MTILGYARVSTNGQVLDIQEFNYVPRAARRFTAEKKSGISDKRPLL